MNHEIVYIETDKLHPHPDNPRRDVGDISELADSIKVKGIMQNLTVVKENDLTDGYTVVIGHRRLAAAKSAGLAKLPCVIAEMDPREQVATMLLENMQRSDLTILEQAQGFQMMLDLGETQSSIAEQTGFSKTTVSRRLKLLKLDKEKFQSAESRGGTLEDYVKAAEIEDEKERNKVTDAIGTSNFSWFLKDAMKKQTLKKALPLIRAEMKQIGAKKNDQITPWDGKHDVVVSVLASDFKEGCIANKAKKHTEYFWNIRNVDNVYLYKLTPKKKKEVVKKSAAELRAIARRKELAAITEKAYECRKDFVLDFSACKKDLAILNEWLWELIYRSFSGLLPGTDFALLCEKTGEEYERYKYYCDRESLDRYVKESPGNAPIVLLYSMCGDKKETGYYRENFGDSMPEHRDNNVLDFVYEYLCKLGYEMSDDEKALQNGTHELFNMPG